MKKYFYLFLFFFVLVAGSVKADTVKSVDAPLKEENSVGLMHYRSIPTYKEPFIGGLLSWTWPGMGQFYSQSYTKGSIFLFTDLVQKGLFVYLGFHLADKYSAENNGIATFSRYDTSDQIIFVGYFFSVLALKIWSTVDAIQTVKEYNIKIYNPSTQTGDMFMRPEMNNDISRNYSVGISRTFHF